MQRWRRVSEEDREIILNPATSQAPSTSLEDLLQAQAIISEDTTPEIIAKVEPIDPQEEAIKKRMHRTTFQARLGRKMDTIHRRILDNDIRLSSHPTNMLRIAIERDPRSRDIVSRTIESAEVLPIILPPMQDIPIRHLSGYRDGQDVIVPSLYTIDQKEYFEIYAPVRVKLNPDDLLIRIIYDDVNCPDDPYVIVLQVSEQFATIGYSAVRHYKYWVTYYNEKLPQTVIDIIKKDQTKRQLLGW